MGICPSFSSIMPPPPGTGKPVSDRSRPYDATDGDSSGPVERCRSKSWLIGCGMAIRAARLSDTEGIRAITNHEILNGTSTFELEPRTLAAQRAWLQDRSGVHAVIVATPEGDDATVIGFASLSPYRSRPAYNTTVENSVYVHQDHRGEGIGRALLEELIEVAQNHGFHTVMARISGGNVASKAVHLSVGFEVVGIERQVGRKFGRWLDVTIMQLMLQDWSGPGRI